MLRLILISLLSLTFGGKALPAEICTKGNCNRPAIKAVAEPVKKVAKQASIVVKRTVSHCVVKPAKRVKCCRKRLFYRVRCR